MAQEPLRTESAADDVAARDDGRTRERKATSGDRDALAALLREHGPAIGQLCHFVAGPRDAKDAAQEAFEKIVVNIQKFDPDKGSFKTWALTVARNACRDRLRRRGLEKRTFLADGETQTDLARANVPDPERLAVARAGASRLTEALATLPENQRAAVVLFHFHEATYEEIAATLDAPMGTVMTWLHRARKKLRAQMEEAAEVDA
jgi:RNA polymerase sigma-70 factor (ECF subfamily)